MLTAIGVHPVTEGAFVDAELLCHSGNRARCLDHHLHGFILEFRREALLRPGQFFHLSRLPILMDGLSGRLGAPQRHLPLPESLGSASSVWLPSAIGAASRWLAFCSVRAYWVSKISALVHLGSH